MHAAVVACEETLLRRVPEVCSVVYARYLGGRAPENFGSPCLVVGRERGVCKSMYPYVCVCVCVKGNTREGGALVVKTYRYRDDYQSG